MLSSDIFPVKIERSLLGQYAQNVSELVILRWKRSSGCHVDLMVTVGSYRSQLFLAGTEL
jgi:hypothetical protein